MVWIHEHLMERADVDTAQESFGLHVDWQRLAGRSESPNFLSFQSRSRHCGFTLNARVRLACAGMLLGSKC